MLPDLAENMDVLRLDEEVNDWVKGREYMGKLDRLDYNVKGSRSPGKLERWRSSFTNKRGGKFIHFEAVALGLILASLLYYNSYSGIWVIGIPALVIFALPILMSVFSTLALLVAVLFSLMWGFTAFLFGAAIFRDSVLIGILCGIIAWFISFRVHKNFAGIQLHGFRRREGGIPHDSTSKVPEYRTEQRVVFCPQCGRRITSADGSCDFCGRT